jgi:hypothetical protein
VPNQSFITGILALAFLVAGHFFMTAYIEYNVDHKKLVLLRGQERFIKNQIKKFGEKKQVLARLNKFFDQAKQSGLTKDKWDLFYVNLKNKPFSFLDLQTVLAQTSHSLQYYFQPDSLSIRMGYIKSDVSQSTETVNSEMLEPVQADADVFISLNGHFLVKRREQELNRVDIN